jgi:hypothetical protein
MIVEQVNVGNIIVLELKNNPPVGANGDASIPGEFALKLV